VSIGSLSSARNAQHFVLVPSFGMRCVIFVVLALAAVGVAFLVTQVAFFIESRWKRRSGVVEAQRRRTERQLRQVGNAVDDVFRQARIRMDETARPVDPGEAVE
jgi:Flp pilus assembly protein TadB